MAKETRRTWRRPASPAGPPRQPAIDDATLRRLSIVAQHDRERFFAEHPRWRRIYGDRLLTVVLCYEGVIGDLSQTPLEVWSLYRRDPDGAFPNRERRVAHRGHRGTEADHVALLAHLEREVVLVERGIPARILEDPAEVVRRYLRHEDTASTRRLTNKTIVLLEPAERRGEVVWPVGNEPAEESASGA